MKHTLYTFLCLLLAVAMQAQDKIYLKNGTLLKCKIVSIGPNTITYKDSANTVNPNVTLNKTEVIVAEYANGAMFIFGTKNDDKTKGSTNSISGSSGPGSRRRMRMDEWKEYERTLGDNVIGFYPVELPLGRFTVSYEHFFADKDWGITIPVSLTYNSLSTSGSIIKNDTSSNYTAPNVANSGVGLMTGIDVNRYFDLSPRRKCYFGARYRYGKDIMLGIQGYTFQMQQGVMMSKGDHFINSFSVGIGFFSTTDGDRKGELVPWASLNWRLGFRF